MKGGCRVCQHRERAAIDLALARSVSVPALSRRYGVSDDSIYNHARKHLPQQLRAKLLCGPSLEGVDLDHLKATESQSLLVNLIAIRHRLFAALDAAEELGNIHLISRLTSQLHKNLELCGKLLGDLGVGSTSVTNILISDSYVELRVELVKALAPFADARHAVAQVLHRLEHKAAEDIRSESRELAQ